MAAPREYRSINFWDVALSRAVVLRAFRVAVVVGSILACINHGDRLFSLTQDGDTMWRVMLTFCVPYCVSTYSSVLAVREFRASQDNR